MCVCGCGRRRGKGLVMRKDERSDKVVSTDCSLSHPPSPPSLIEKRIDLNKKKLETKLGCREEEGVDKMK
jgi:hypothetical protein